jgi:hypothetical protein
MEAGYFEFQVLVENEQPGKLDHDLWFGGGQNVSKRLDAKDGSGHATIMPRSKLEFLRRRSSSPESSSRRPSPMPKSKSRKKKPLQREETSAMQSMACPSVAR